MIIYKKLYEFLNNNEKEKFYKIIDYTRISNDLTIDQIKDICKEAENNNFYAICILPQFVATTRSFLKRNIKIAALIDFPKGESDTKYKIDEMDTAIINGSEEIDVVINYKLVKNEEDHESLAEEIRKLTEYCHREGVIIKIIIEIGDLNFQEIETICKMSSDVDYIMTSTGKLPNDDTFENKIEKVKFMRKILPDEVKIKISGGIRTIEQVKDVLPFVDRIGVSIILN